jgi:hypothetical protein
MANSSWVKNGRYWELKQVGMKQTHQALLRTGNSDHRKLPSNKAASLRSSAHQKNEIKMAGCTILKTMFSMDTVPSQLQSSTLINM